MKSHTEYLTPRSLFGEPGSSRSEELAQRRLEDAEAHREIEDREATPDVVSLLMERTRRALEKLQLRIAAGKLKQPEKIGAASRAAAAAEPRLPLLLLGDPSGGACGTSRTRQAWGARRGSRVDM